MAETIRYDAAEGGRIEADLYPGGAHGVLLAHGKVFDKDSWAERATGLQGAGYTVLAPNFRGYGESTGDGAPKTYAADVAGGLAALRARGCGPVSVIGGSMGAIAAAEAAIAGLAGEVALLMLLSPRQMSAPEDLAGGHVAFVVSEDEDCAADVRAMYDACTAEKSLEVYPGAAHAQFLFDSDQAEALNQLIRDRLQAASTAAA